jgi:hypothetical protein
MRPRGSVDAIHFEIAEFAWAVRLAGRLGKSWRVVIHERSGVTVVTAALGPTPGDLSALLREVEAWAGEESFPAIPFEIDGKEYVLEASND